MDEPGQLYGTSIAAKVKLKRSLAMFQKRENDDSLLKPSFLINPFTGALKVE